MIHTSHPGNIGAAARAMKVMGISDLCLVNPKSFPDDQAYAMSANATDILENTTVVTTLAEAIRNCRLVVGSSARHERSLSWDIQDSRECGVNIARHAKNAKVALLFGRESSGLTNNELAVCQHLVHIPTNPDYSSLNVASAVQLLAYECRLSALKNDSTINDNKAEKGQQDKWVTAEEMDGFFQHLKQVMEEVDFLDPENPRHLMTRLRRLYSRSSMTLSELNIQRGFLAAIQKKNN